MLVEEMSYTKVRECTHRTLTKMGSITVRLTSCLFCLDSAALLM